MTFFVMERAKPNHVETTGIIFVMGVNSCCCAAPFAWPSNKFPNFQGILDGLVSDTGG